MNWRQTSLGYRSAYQVHLMVKRILSNILVRDHNVPTSWLHGQLKGFFIANGLKVIRLEP